MPDPLSIIPTSAIAAALIGVAVLLLACAVLPLVGRRS